MTRRERLERKLERRREWSEKAEKRSDQHYQIGHKMFDAIPFGQPILVGHHSESRDRSYRNRASGHMDKFVEQKNLAEHHDSKADGLEHQLDKAIFSDDGNAIEALEARISENEAKREGWKNINKLYRKGDATGLAALGLDLEALREKLKTAYSWMQQPYPAYELSNLGGRITTDRKRLEYIKQESARHDLAEAAPNGVTLEDCSGGYCRVTFAEKPDRSILDALRGAGFFWCKGHWGGKRDAVPQVVLDLIGKAEEPKPPEPA